MSEADKAQAELRKAGVKVTADSTRAQVVKNRFEERAFKQELARKYGPGKR